MRRIGVFGGTFDPVHLGHLILADQCRESGRLDEVWFVLAGNPPHKQGQSVTPFEQRAEMIELAIAGNPAFRLDTVEKEMAGPTYTANMLAELHRRYLEDRLYLLLGSDSLEDLPGWYRPEVVVASASLLVMQRPSHPARSSGELLAAMRLPPDAGLRIEYVPQPPLIDLASSDLRRRLSRGRSIRYLVPRAVEIYIKEKRLYHPPGPEA
jgi:nicotinate-nucleotide adenylyltransferase